jgi:hypothetical protein
MHVFSTVIADDKPAFLCSRAHALLLGELPTVGGCKDELQGRKTFVPNLVTLGVLITDILLELLLNIAQKIGEDTVESSREGKDRKLEIADSGKVTRTEA